MGTMASKEVFGETTLLQVTGECSLPVSAAIESIKPQNQWPLGFIPNYQLIGQFEMDQPPHAFPVEDLCIPCCISKIFLAVTLENEFVFMVAPKTWADIYSSPFFFFVCSKHKCQVVFSMWREVHDVNRFPISLTEEKTSNRHLTLRFMKTMTEILHQHIPLRKHTWNKQRSFK